MNYFKNRIKALGYAFSGLIQAMAKEKNLQLQGFISLLVIMAGCYFEIGQLRWVAVIGCITLVIALELFNSAIEKMCDLYSKEQDLRIKYIKDVAAGAVLVACIFAASIGLMVFLPYILEMIKAW